MTASSILIETGQIQKPSSQTNSGSKGLPTIFKFPGDAKEAYVCGTFSTRLEGLASIFVHPLIDLSSLSYVRADVFVLHRSMRDRENGHVHLFCSHRKPSMSETLLLHNSSIAPRGSGNN